MTATLPACGACGRLACPTCGEAAKAVLDAAAAPKIEPRPDAKPNSNPCDYCGERISLPTASGLGIPGPARSWYVCEHPGRPNPRAQLRGSVPYVCPCEGCNYTCRGYAHRTPDHEPPRGTGIVIGTYGLPQLARLQVKLIRETCGDVPILFADDAAELAHPGTDAAFHAITEEFPGVTYWPSAERRGHYAGDLSVFWKGLQWAQGRGLRWLCKLSQRMLWTRVGWLADAVRELEASGLPTMFQGCIDNGKDLYCRSECVLMDARVWGQHWQLFDRPKLHNATEFYLWDLVYRFHAKRFHVWSEIPLVRELRPRPGAFVWHTCHGDADYAALHARFGVAPDRRGGSQSMTASGWQWVPGWKKG